MMSKKDIQWWFNRSIEELQEYSKIHLKFMFDRITGEIFAYGKVLGKDYDEIQSIIDALDLDDNKQIDQ